MTYSFLDVVAAIEGEGGSINLATGAGSAEEGITIEPIEDKNIMTIGADGAGMHSLVASEASTVTIRLLKTSPVNGQLSQMYNIQTTSSSKHGKNTVTIRDNQRGDTITLTEVAFKKRPTLNFAKEGGTVEWMLDAAKTETILGNGSSSK